jgi:tetratricopeptide (TPR) repeat protein
MFLKRFFSFIPRNEFSRALDLFNQGHYQKALRMFDDLLGRYQPGDDVDVATIELYACESHVALARESMNEGNLEQACREMELAVDLKPNFADLRFTLGTLHMELGRFQEAGHNFGRALEINPKFFKASANLAQAHFASSDRQAAMDQLDKAKEYCPTFYKQNLNDLTHLIRIDEDHEEVRRAFHEILEERPSSAQVSREVAIEAIQNGNFTEAIRELKKAIALNPDYPDLHNYLGIAYGNNAMVDDSIEEFEVSLKINPYYLKARLNLALALYDCGRYIEAQSHIERVLSVKPDNQLARNLQTELKAVSGGRR